MVILVLIAAVIFYVVIYVVYNNAQGSMDSAAGMMRYIEEAALRPQPLIFMILRGLILVTIFYIFADLLVSSARRVKRNREIKAEKEEPPTLKLKDPSMR